MVEKGPEAYRTIGEASKEVGEPSYVLRFWETKFNQIKLQEIFEILLYFIFISSGILS